MHVLQLALLVMYVLPQVILSTLIFALTLMGNHFGEGKYQCDKMGSRFIVPNFM
jgi:hypothetical protein